MIEEKNQYLNEISSKLSLLIAVEFKKDERSLSDKIEYLVRFGLSNQEIADIVNTTKGTVEVTKSNLRKSKKLSNKKYE